MDEKILIKKINNLVSTENICNNQLKFDKELASVVNMYTIDDIESLIRYMNENTMSILNDITATKEFNNLLENLLNKNSIELNVTNMSKLINKLYQPKNINFSYRQHCNEIFTLLLNTITDNTFPDEYVYELLYEKLLVNQLNSIDTINSLIDNDLNRYVQQEKIILVRESIKDLLVMKNICCIDDMKICISDIRQKLNINNEVEKQKKLIDIVKDTDYSQHLNKIYEVTPDFILDTDNQKEINMANKKKINLNDSEFAENDKESMEDDLEDIEGTDDNMEPDTGFSADDLEQENLSLKTKIKSLSRQLANLSIKKGKLNTMKLRRNLNSIIIDEGNEDNVNEITEITQEQPPEMREDNLNGNVKQVAIELSKIRKMIMSLAAKTEKAINLSRRESALNRSYIQLSQTAGELAEITDETTNLSRRESALNRSYIQLSEAAEELEEITEDLENDVENSENSTDYEYIEEIGTQEVNNSRRSRFNNDVSHRAINVNMSSARNSVNGKSALDIMMSRR